MNFFLQCALALAAGVGLGIQPAINSRLAAGLGAQPLLAALLSFAVGTACLLAVAVPAVDWGAALPQFARQPWWRWTGGALGAVLVFASALLAPRLGVTNMVLLLILGQVAAGMAVDALGLFEMPVRALAWWRLAGLALMLAGLALVLFGARWFEKTPAAPPTGQAPAAGER